MSDKQEGALSHNKKRTRVSDHQERSASPPRCNPPPWTSEQTRQYFRTRSTTLPGPADSSNSSSDTDPAWSPLPGRGLGIQEARQWLLDSFNQSTIEEVLPQITSGVSSSAPTSDSQSAPTEHSGSAASSAASATTTDENSLEWFRCAWLEAELGNKVEIKKFEKKVVKAALERKKYYLMDNMAAFLLYYAPGNAVPQSASRRIDMLVEVAFR